MDIYTTLARQTIIKYLTNQKLPVSREAELLKTRSGCFVSLHQKDNDKLRGCIGTILPIYKNLAAEIIANTVSAATNDPRFEPINKGELDNLNISIDILSKPEPIDSNKLLDPKKYGVIITAINGRTGVLLPDLKGVHDINSQLSIARQKAGIADTEPVLLYRFTVDRHTEDANS